MLVEGLHAVLFPALFQIVLDGGGFLGVLDAILNGFCVPHYFAGDNTALAVFAQQEPLRDDGPQRFGQAHPRRVLLRGLEYADESRDGLGRVGGMDRAENQVAGFRGLQRDVDRLPVTHLAHHDHVGVLAQSGPERLGETLRVRADFPLDHGRLCVAKEKFDRVLDRDDFPGLALVDVADHRRQRGGFAAAGDPCQQHEPALLHGDLFQDRRQSQLFEVGNLERDRPQHQRERASLAADVDAKPADIA